MALLLINHTQICHCVTLWHCIIWVCSTHVKKWKWVYRCRNNSLTDTHHCLILPFFSLSIVLSPTGPNVRVRKPKVSKQKYCNVQSILERGKKYENRPKAQQFGPHLLANGHIVERDRRINLLGALCILKWHYLVLKLFVVSEAYIRPKKEV